VVSSQGRRSTRTACLSSLALALAPTAAAPTNGQQLAKLGGSLQLRLRVLRPHALHHGGQAFKLRAGIGWQGGWAWTSTFEQKMKAVLHPLTGNPADAHAKPTRDLA
jgi:hypothetical protein